MSRIRLITLARPALAALLALALSLTAPQPARAQNNPDEAIAAFLALGLIGLAIGAANQGQAAPEYETHRPGRHVLPAQCLREYETRQGLVRLMAGRCLERNYGDTRYLPARCEEHVRVRRGAGPDHYRDMYRLRCLRQEGYRIGRARD